MPMNMTQHLHHHLALLLAFFAFASAGLLSDRVFEHLPHLEDEVAYLYQARIFAGGQLTVDIPEPRRAFWQPFVVDYTATGQRFGKYTPGWPALLALGVNFGQPWIINAFGAALAVALLYRLGGQLFGREAGLIAALLAAFSPAALLLNASLMAHTAALVLALVFLLAYRRLERSPQPLRWALLAGLALGGMASIRPLSALATALPLIAWSGVRLLRPLLARHARAFWATLRPLLLLSAAALILSASIPAFSVATTGDPARNLYELVWAYDRIGFGECCGRSGHTLEKAFRHARFDLSLAAADLFGWHPAPLDDVMREHLLTQADYWPGLGLSFALLPFGLLAGLRWRARRRPEWRAALLLIVWLIGAILIATQPLRWGGETLAAPATGWLYVAGGLLWLHLPLLRYLRRDDEAARWTWLLLALLGSILLVQMTYWIGSQRYSTRYYYEALIPAALLTALPLAWLARRLRRWPVYLALGALSVAALFHYSLPRIEVLFRFNYIGRDQLEALQAQRVDDRPIFLLITGPAVGDERVRWRALGTYMTVTSPYFDSEIVAAWNYDPANPAAVREPLLARFADRQLIEMIAEGNEAYFVDSPPLPAAPTAPQG